MSDQGCKITQRQTVTDATSEKLHLELEALKQRYEQLERQYTELQAKATSSPDNSQPTHSALEEKISIPLIEVSPSDGHITWRNNSARTLLGEVDNFEGLLPLKTLTSMVNHHQKQEKSAKPTALHVQLPLSNPTHEVSLHGQSYHLRLEVLQVTSSGALLSLHDESELHAQQQLANKHRRYKNIIEGLSCCLIIFSADGKTIEANRAACHFFGRRLSDLLDFSISQLFQVDEDWTQKNYLEVFCGDLCKQSKLVSLEVFGCSSSGQASPRSPLPDQPPSAYVIIFKDITSTTSKQLEMETRLQSSEKRVNDLTVDSIFKRCWDSLYKQVLTCATANLELMYGVCQTVNVALLRADADGPQSVTGEVQMVKKCARHLTTLLNDLTDVHHLTKETELHNVDAGGFLHGMMKAFRHTCLQQMQEIHINHYTPDEERVIFTNTPYLRQIIHLLLIHIYRQKKDNTLNISILDKRTSKSKQNPGRLLMEVSMLHFGDKGGIGLGKLQQLLNVPFIDLDGSRELTSEFLMIRYLAKAIDCTVALERTTSDGCTFTLSLPERAHAHDEDVKVSSSDSISLVNSGDSSLVMKSDQSESEHNASVRRLSEGLSMTLGLESQMEKYHCLAVDDNKMNLLMIKRILQSVGFTVTLANDGHEAQKIVDKLGHQIDVILLDVIMPGITGYEVCQNIRKKFLPIELPIILLTAKGQVRSILNGFECGANDYLTKPFHKLELVARLFSHVRLGRVNRAYNRFVPRQFLELLGKDLITNISIGDHAQLDMPVMFTDIRSFTSISEDLSPKQVFDFLNVLLRSLGPVIRRHDGFIDKYIGDAIMALFPNSPFGALNAAVDIIKCLNSIDFSHDTPYLSSTGQTRIRMGVGIHTGPLIIGTVGECERMDTTVIADTVNIASRIEGLTKAFGVDILVTQNLIDGLTEAQKTTVAFRCVGKLNVKGKRKPLVLYEVFEGDQEPIRQLKIDTHDQFQQALHNVMEGHYGAAREQFSQLSEDDPVVAYYIYFCGSLLSREGITDIVIEKDGLVAQFQAPIGGTKPKVELTGATDDSQVALNLLGVDPTLEAPIES